MRMIYDCFTYCGESAVLKVRCEELKPLGVTHVLVESRYTFTKKEKTLYFEESKDSFKEYNIRHVIVENTSLGDNPWDEETLQRNAIMSGLSGAANDDIVIVGDVDEIPSVKAVQSYRTGMGLTALRMDVFWYKFNCLAEKQSWIHSRIMPYSYLKNKTPQEVRASGYDNTIDNAGWHFSYMGDADYIVNKLNSFSHQEYNTDQHRDKKEITRKIEAGISLWGGSQFRFIPIDKKFPKYIYENQKEFQNLIH